MKKCNYFRENVYNYFDKKRLKNVGKNRYFRVFNHLIPPAVQMRKLPKFQKPYFAELSLPLLVLPHPHSK